MNYSLAAGASYALPSAARILGHLPTAAFNTRFCPIGSESNHKRREEPTKLLLLKKMLDHQHKPLWKKEKREGLYPSLDTFSPSLRRKN